MLAVIKLKLTMSLLPVSTRYDLSDIMLLTETKCLSLRCPLERKSGEDIFKELLTYMSDLCLPHD